MSSDLSGIHVGCQNAIKRYCIAAVLRHQNDIMDFAVNTPERFTSGIYTVNGTKKEIEILSKAEYYNKIRQLSSLYDSTDTLSANDLWFTISVVAAGILVALGIYLLSPGLVTYSAILAFTGSCVMAICSVTLYKEIKDIKIAALNIPVLLEELSYQHLARAQKCLFKGLRQEGISSEEKKLLALEIGVIFGCIYGDSEEAEANAKKMLKDFNEETDKTQKHHVELAEETRFKRSQRATSLKKMLRQQVNDPTAKKLLELSKENVAKRLGQSRVSS